MISFYHWRLRSASGRTRRLAEDPRALIEYEGPLSNRGYMTNRMAAFARFGPDFIP
jgi:hypothetical protein